MSRLFARCQAHALSRLLSALVFALGAVAAQAADIWQAARDGDVPVLQQSFSSGANLNARDDAKGWTPLLYAIDEQRSSAVQALLAAGADVNLTSAKGMAPVGLAAARQDLAITRYLLDHGADPNHHDRPSNVPLAWAAAEGTAASVQLLLDRGAKINGAGFDGTTALFMAACKGRLDILKQLQSQGGDIERGPKGFTPLMGASMNGHIEIVRHLLDSGARVNAFDNINVNTALTMAAQNDRTEIGLLLLQHGADADRYDSSARPLQNTCLFGNSTLALALLEHGAKVRHDDDGILEDAARAGMTQVVAALVEHGVSLRDQWQEEETLKSVLTCGYGEVARLLLEGRRRARGIATSARVEQQQKLLPAAESGNAAQIETGLAAGQANPEILAMALEIAQANGNIEAAQRLSLARWQAAARLGEWDAVAARLASAAETGDAELVRSLLAQGLDPIATNDFGTPILHIAAEHGHVEVLKLLLNAGAPVDLEDEVGTTPLFAAVMRRQLEVMRVLLESGASLDNERAVASLHECATLNWTAGLELLFQHHMDPNARGFGGTALIDAVERGNAEAVRVLLDHGADPNAADDRGQAPLSLAKIVGDPEVVRMLQAASAREGSAPITSPLFQALDGDPARFRRMLENGADPNARGPTHWQDTPLDDVINLGTIRGNRFENAKLLLEFGADVNRPTGMLVTLARSSTPQAVELARLMIARGADPVSRGRYVTGDTPLTMAAEHGNLEMVRLLLESGADPEIRKNDGQSALDVARAEGHLEIVKLLEQWRAQHRQPSAPAGSGGKP